jgi:cell division protein FtsB
MRNTRCQSCARLKKELDQTIACNLERWRQMPANLVAMEKQLAHEKASNAKLRDERAALLGRINGLHADLAAVKRKTDQPVAYDGPAPGWMRLLGRA